MASHDSGPDPMAARFELADLIVEAEGGLSDCDRAVLELSYRHGLEGFDLAAALEVSVAQARTMALRVRQSIERSLGALLVARSVRRNPGLCLELAMIVNGWDGDFTALMRKRVTRHIESCFSCELERRRLVTPAVLLGTPTVFMPAPDWLRATTLRRIRLAPANSGIVTLAAPNAGLIAVDGPDVQHRGSRRLLALVSLLALFLATVFTGHSLSIESPREHTPGVVAQSPGIPRFIAPPTTFTTPPPAPAHISSSATTPPPAPARVPAPTAAPSIKPTVSAPSPEPVDAQPTPTPTPTTADATALRAAANSPQSAPATKKPTAKPAPRPTTVGTPGRKRHTPKPQPPAESPASTDSVS